MRNNRETKDEIKAECTLCVIVSLKRTNITIVFWISGNSSFVLKDNYRRVQ